MVVWGVEDDGGDSPTGNYYYVTRREAVAHAREVREDGRSTAVNRITLAHLLKNKLVILLLNHQGFAAESKTVLRLEPKKETE